MKQSGVFDQRSDVLLQSIHRDVTRVSTGDQQIVHLGVLPQVVVDDVDFSLQEHVLVTTDLRVTETVGAEREAVLRGLIEDELDLRVLVLTSVQDLGLPRIIGEPRLVELLVTVVRISFPHVLGGDALTFVTRAGLAISLHDIRPDHAGLRENQLEHGVPGRIRPVDAVQSVPRDQEPVDVDEEFALFKETDTDPVLLEQRANLTEAADARVVVFPLG